MYHVEIEGPNWCRFGSPFTMLAPAYCMAKNCADKPNMYGKTRVIDDDGNVHKCFPTGTVIDDALSTGLRQDARRLIAEGRHATELLEKVAAEGCCKIQKENGIVPYDYTMEELFSRGVVKTATVAAQLQDWVNSKSLDVEIELRLRQGSCSIHVIDCSKTPNVWTELCCVNKGDPNFDLRVLMDDILRIIK